VLDLAVSIYTPITCPVVFVW